VQTDRNRCGKRGPSEQQRQVVVSRPCQQVPPVTFFSPDAAAGVRLMGGESSNPKTRRPLGLREEGLDVVLGTDRGVGFRP
jgi:hypothetical protein